MDNIQHTQPMQLNVPIQTQNGGQTKYPPDSEKRRQKSSSQYSQRRKIPETEPAKHQKKEYENNKVRLKALMEKYGSKQQVISELDSETIKMRENIAKLKFAVQNKGKQLQVSPQPQPPPQPTVKEVRKNPTEFSIWRGFFTLLWLPFQLLFQLLRVIYRNLNWNIILFGLLLIELSLIILIWGVRRTYHTYYYVDPYEPVVHGTYGVEPPSQFVSAFWSSLTIIQDFFGEVMSGARGFGSPGYGGFVPI